MSEAWRDAWDKVKDSAAASVHNGWMETKLAHGFADHPWAGDHTTCGLLPGNCGYAYGKHHTDMIPFADLSPLIKAYDYETAIRVFPVAFEAGVKAEREREATS